MSTEDKSLETLISKIEMSEKILNHASEKIHNAPMTETLRELSNKRKSYIDRNASIIHKNPEDVSLGIKDQIVTEARKLGMEIDGLYLRRNEKETLGLCIEQDESLVKDYQNTLNSLGNSGYKQEIERQLSEIKGDLQELKEMRQGYNYV